MLAFIKIFTRLLGRDIAHLIFSFWDETMHRAIICRAYMHLEIKCILATELSNYTPADILSSYAVPFAFQYLAAEPRIHRLLREKELITARYVRRPSYHIPITSECKTIRWYSNDNNPMGFECICGCVRSDVSKLMCPDHMSNRIHTDVTSIYVDSLTMMWDDLAGDEMRSDEYENLSNILSYSEKTANFSYRSWMRGWLTDRLSLRDPESHDLIYETFPKPGRAPSYIKGNVIS